MKNMYPVIRSSRTARPAALPYLTAEQGLNTIFKFLESLPPKLPGKCKNRSIFGKKNRWACLNINSGERTLLFFNPPWASLLTNKRVQFPPSLLRMHYSGKTSKVISAWKCRVLWQIQLSNVCLDNLCQNWPHIKLCRASVHCLLQVWVKLPLGQHYCEGYG